MPFLLACKVSAEKSADSLMGVLLCVTSCFILAAFRMLSLSLPFTLLIFMCLDVVSLGSSYAELSGIPGPGCVFPSSD